MDPTFDLESYLERIKLAQAPEADAAGLAALHEAHLLAIPFENLDIALGRPIRLDPPALFDKLVAERRGGFCFEMNGLFAGALKAAGFAPRPRLARVWVGGATEPRPLTHQVLLVETGGRDWLADVGFGGPGFRRPLPLEAGRVDAQPDGRYRLQQDPDFGWLLEVEGEAGWERLYSFTDTRCWPADFAMGSHFAATHPASLFTQRLVATVATPSGRTHLLDERLTVTQPGRPPHISTLAPGEPWLGALAAHFGIALDAPYEALRPPHRTA